MIPTKRRNNWRQRKTVKKKWFKCVRSQKCNGTVEAVAWRKGKCVVERWRCGWWEGACETVGVGKQEAAGRGGHSISVRLSGGVTVLYSEPPPCVAWCGKDYP